MSAKRYLKPGIVGAVILGAGVLGYFTLYEQPRQQLSAELEQQHRQNEMLERSLRDAVRVRQELRAAGSSTLGANVDEVHARFRTGLQRIADEIGLTGVRIDTRSPEGVLNPIVASKRRITGMPNLRGQHDFSVVRGDLNGSGSLDQVMRTMAFVEIQPWVHRIDGFSIRPEGRSRENYTLSMQLSTVLMPRELAPRDGEGLQVVQLGAEAPTMWASLVAKNPFREPPPAPRTAEAPRPPRPTPAPPPAPPPYNEWRLAGVVESRIGTEAFLVNTRNEERVAIGTGASVSGAKLVSAEGERAVFEIEGEEYEVFNGQTLEQRRPTNR